jgi:hypothetical protein
LIELAGTGGVTKRYRLEADRRSGDQEIKRSGDQAIRRSGHHCTFPVTLAFPFRVNVQVLVLLALLEQAPDQIASRPFVTLSVMDVPAANGAEPLVPTLTLMPAGLDVTRSPLRPVAVTVNVAACDGGFTVRTAVRVAPL